MPVMVAGRPAQSEAIWSDAVGGNMAVTESRTVQSTRGVPVTKGLASLPSGVRGRVDARHPARTGVEP
ncbi:MAG TPA: hypothetical protein VLS92_00980 [Acidimicrobiia bacterium]|nr:hypothetical protein [Acidimicrobiia bacterium]